MSATRVSILLFTCFIVYLQVHAVEESISIKKRQRDWPYVASPNCEFIPTFKIVNDSVDRFNRPVKIAQNLVTQYFHVVECTSNFAQNSETCPECCVGVDPSQHHSRCQVTTGLQRAYVCKNPDHCISGRFEFVLIDNGCTCMIQQN